MNKKHRESVSIQQRRFLYHKFILCCFYILITSLLGHGVYEGVWKGVNPSMNVKCYYAMDSICENLSWLVNEEDESMFSRQGMSCVAQNVSEKELQ